MFPPRTDEGENCEIARVKNEYSFLLELHEFHNPLGHKYKICKLTHAFLMMS